MQISTNYSNFSAPVRSDRFNKNVSKTDLKSNDISFQGIERFFKPSFKKSIVFDKETNSVIDYIASTLDIKSENIKKMLSGKTIKQMNFLHLMADRYNANNFSKELTEKEDVNIVLDLFNRISSPQKEHISAIQDTNFNMTTIKKCFDRFNDNPEKIDKAMDVYRNTDVLRKNSDVFEQIMDSPNTEEYITNFDKYAPKIQVADDTKGIIAKFDKMISGEKTSADALSGKNIEGMLDKFPESSLLAKEKFVENYSFESENILNNIRFKFAPTKQSIEEGDYKGILKIYNSTTKENAEFRTQFIEANYHNFGKRQEYNENEINDLASLLEYADKNKDAKEFLSYSTRNGYGTGVASGYIKLFDTIGAEKLNKNAEAVHNTMIKNQLRPVDAVLEYFNKTENSFWGKIKSLFGKKTERIIPVREVVTIDTMSKLGRNAEEFMPKPLVIKKPYIAPVIESKPEIIKPKRQYYVFKPYVPAQPNAKKLVVINNVNNIIEKKLGLKTLSEQKSIYADKATKMRAGMLNEIFDSIKDTRKTEKANGIFRKSKSVSNSDAVDLYTRINGKNKKLVNYMLKKRNADGTRQFSVKDIIDTLAEGNKTIIENKIARKEEKAVYDAILNQKIEQYGKLKTKKA